MDKIEQLNLMIRNSTILPKGDSKTTILYDSNGNITKEGLNDPRFKELERLKLEKPDNIYFYVNKIENPILNNYKVLGKYVGLNYLKNYSKYALQFDESSIVFDDSTGQHTPIFLGTGEIFYPKTGGKKRKSSRKVRKSSRRVKRRNTKRRYRK